MDCNDSVSEAEATSNMEAVRADDQVPGDIGMEQDVDLPEESKKCFVGKRFECYDDMMAMSLKATYQDEREAKEFQQVVAFEEKENVYSSYFCKRKPTARWNCVTNVESKPNEVKVYDSMCTGDIPMHTKEVIASLVRLSQTYLFLTFPDVQQQVGSSDCGLYSLAFAYSLSSGKDPAKLEYI